MDIALLHIFLAPVRDCQPAQAAIVALLVLILLDWIFGISNALMKREFSSKVMREGIAHKCSELGFVLVGWIADAMLLTGLDLGLNGPILVTVTMYLCVMEIGSLLETFVKMNPKLGESPIFKLLASVHVISTKADAAKEEDRQEA